MKYRIYKGEEVYGRDINYIGKLVLYCEDCGYIGVYTSIEDLNSAKLSHNKLHNKENI